MTKNKIILFRGGMCGDHLYKMLEPSNSKNNDHRIMKKFYNFSKQEKDNYYNNTKGYILTHDTDYCKTIAKRVIQIYCSDVALMEKFAQRFWSRNAPDRFNQLNHVMTDMKSTEESKVKDYKNDLEAWQKCNIFKDRFDIKNVFKNTFVDDVRKHFKIENLLHAETTHQSWLLSQ